MIYLHYKDTKTFGHSFSFLLIFNALSANYLQVGNFSNIIYFYSIVSFLPFPKPHVRIGLMLRCYAVTVLRLNSEQ